MDGRSVQQSSALARRSATRAVQLGFFVFMIAVVAAGLWAVVQRQRPANDIPEQIAGYRLVRSIKGQQALQVVATLHQGSPQMADAWIGYYDKGAVVWVGIAGSPEAAQQQVDAMVQAIGRGKTPFSPPQAAQLAGRQVFLTKDQGGTNYFFSSGSRVIWVTPPFDGGTAFLDATLKGL